MTLRRAGLAAATVLTLLAATGSPRVAAQTAPLQIPVQVAPLQPPQSGTPSQSGQSAAPQATAPNGSSPGSQQPAGPPSPPPSLWQPRDVVDLKLLDKVNARSATLSGRVGQTLQFGSLTIVVRACQVRPPDQPADAAAYLDITDSHPDAPSFHGWMFANEPSVSMLEHPIYDVRVTSCHS